MISNLPPLPVDLHPRLVDGLGKSRVRAAILPMGAFARLREGDLLWVREQIFVEDKQVRGGELRIKYTRDRYWQAIAWPWGRVRPRAGYHPAGRMPVECSRYTLRVASAEARRLSSIESDEAVACGVIMDPDGGFVPATAESDTFKPFGTPSEALGYAWQEAGYGDPGENPEVMLVEFTAMARNVGRLVSGMGTGGSRRAS